MVLFLGLSFREDAVDAMVVDRHCHVAVSVEVKVQGARRGDDGVWEVPQQEWVRAGALALGDCYAELPVKLRKLWGLALSGPQGWIAIDPALKPLSPLRLTPGRSPVSDITRWLEANPKQRAHVLQILSPKDWFRLRVSGAVATDVTLASETGLLARDRRAWDAERVAASRFSHDWLPPPFDSAAQTGRLTREGVDMTGLPGGLWLVAGAETGAARQVAAFDPSEGFVYTLFGNDWLELRFPVAAALDGSPLIEPPDGWDMLFSALTGWFDLRCRVAAPAGGMDASFVDDCARRALEALGSLERLDESPGGFVADSAAPLPEWLLELSGCELTDEATLAGLPVHVAPYAGVASPGCAFLAGLSKPFFRDHDDLYRKYGRALEEESAAAAEHDDERDAVDGE